MSLYSYEIGPNSGSMVNVETLTGDGNAPKSTFRFYSQPVAVGDGTVRGAGWKEGTWRWGFLSGSQRDVLRAYCPGASAEIYIRTRDYDDIDSTYKYYSGVMIWPREENRQTGRIIDLEIRFQRLVEYTP